MRIWWKIFVFQIVALIIATTSAYGQSFGAGFGEYINPDTGKASEFSMGVTEYATRGGLQNSDGKKAVDVLKAGPLIYCGDYDTTCVNGKQVCWGCRVTGRLGIALVAETHEHGRCFNGDFNSTKDAAKNWCPQISDGVAITAAIVGSIASIWAGASNVSTQRRQHPNGFLEQKSIRILFWKIDTNKSERTFTGKGPDGKEHKYLLAYDQDNPTLKYADGGSTEGCEVLPIKINRLSGCFFCPLARVVFDTANDAARLSFDKFAKSFQYLIVIAFAVWLAFASLNIVFTFTKQEANKYITNILKQGGKFLFAYFLLAYPQDLFSLFISPILSTGLEMGDRIKYLSDSTGVSDVYTGEKESGEYFAIGGIYDKIEIFLKNIQQQLAVLQAIGSSLFCIGANEITWKALVKKEIIGYSLRSFLLGAILFIFGLLLTVSFAFYFLDGLLQLSILGAMLPMMIAGWPFKVTAKYATEGLKMLLNTAFIMFFTGFVISVEITLIDSALDYVNEKANIVDVKDKGLNALFNAINNQDTEKIRKLTDIGGKGFLLIIFAAIFGFKFVAQVPKMANKLAGGLNLGISSKVATMMTSAAKGTALKATKPLRKAASTWWHKGGGTIGRLAKVGKVPGAIVGFGNKLAHKAGMKDTWVDKFQNKLSSAAQKHEEAAREASLKGGLGNRIKQKWHEALAKREQAASEHGIIGGLASRIEGKAKDVHKSYLASEEYNENRQKQEEAWRRRHGQSDE